MSSAARLSTTGLIPSGFDRETCESDWSDPRWRAKAKRGGLTLRLPNGWKFSAVWGPYCYHSARSLGEVHDVVTAVPFSFDAEIGVFAPGDNRGLMDLGSDTVAGWVSPRNLLAALEAALDDDREGVVRALTRRGPNDGE